MIIGMRMRCDSSSSSFSCSSARSGEPGAYDLIGSLTGFGGVKIPGALMASILELMEVPEVTRYAVSGWGEGELWMEGDVVLAHDFTFGVHGGSHGGTSQLVARLRAFFAGDAVSFDDVELDLGSFTPFQRSVAQTLRGIVR